MEYRQALATGTLLAGEYRIAGTLRQDGFCISYDAEDLQLKSHVLIKEYFPGEIAERVRQSTIRPKSTRQVNMLSWGRQRFIEEAQTLTKFSHPGIARVKRVFEDNNTAYSVVDAQDWPTLISWTDKLHRPLSQSELDQIAKQLLDSLDVLHEARVLVRDLSPDTIYIRDKRQLVLVDFGTAKSQFAARARQMHTVVRPGYSAPEQYLFDDGEQGPWTDIFSLGAVLYRLATGRSPVDVIHRHNANDMPTAVASGAKALRADFLKAIDQCLALDTKARPQSIQALRSQLLGGSGKSPVKPAAAPPPAAAPKTAPKAAAAPPETSPAAHGRKADSPKAEPAAAAAQGAGPTPDRGAGTSTSARPATAAASVASASTPAKAAPATRPPAAAAATPASDRTAASTSTSAPAARPEPKPLAAALPSGLLSDKAGDDDRLGFSVLDQVPPPDPEPTPTPQPRDANAPRTAPDSKTDNTTERTPQAEVEAMAASNRRFMTTVIGIIAGLIVIIGLGLVTLERTLRQTPPANPAEQARLAEEAERKRVADARQLETQKRMAEDAAERRKAEAERLAENKRAAEQAELKRQAEARAQAEAQRLEAERRRQAEVQKAAEEQRAAEARRLEEQKRAAAEAVRLAEQKRVAEEAARAAEAARQAEQQRLLAEVQRLADQKRLAEEAERRRVAEAKKAAEERRLAEERLQAEQKRAAEDAERRRVAEAQKAAEERRLAEERQKAELKRATEEAARLAALQRQQAEQAVVGQVAAAGDRDTLLRLAAQHPGQRAAVERRLLELGYLRVPVGQGTTWLKPGGGEAFQDCPGCPALVVVPAGQFLMGSPPSESDRYDDEDDAPGPGGAAVRITIAQPFAIGRFEVTRGQFAAFVAETRHKTDGGCLKREEDYKLYQDMSWQNPDFQQDDEHPVTCVSWQDAKAYIAWLSRKAGHSYRLLTEAEWEYAARTTLKPIVQPRFPFGADEKSLCAFGNGADLAAKERFTTWQVAPCNDGYQFTSPAGSFAPNAFGVFDLLGNLWEWVEDCYHHSYKDQPAATRATGAAWTVNCHESFRVLRGGSWSDPPSNLRAASRYAIPDTTRIQFAGFRIARALAP